MKMFHCFSQILLQLSLTVPFRNKNGQQPGWDQQVVSFHTRLSPSAESSVAFKLKAICNNI